MSETTNQEGLSHILWKIKHVLNQAFWMRLRPRKTNTPKNFEDLPSAT